MTLTEYLYVKIPRARWRGRTKHGIHPVHSVSVHLSGNPDVVDAIEFAAVLPLLRAVHDQIVCRRVGCGVDGEHETCEAFRAAMATLTDAQRAAVEGGGS